MALDIQKMKDKKAALESKSGNSDFWRPQDGTQTIRILPMDDGDPFKEFFFHYNVGTSGFLCPRKNFGDDCKVCDFGTSLFREGTEESIKQAKNLFARQRFFSPVVVRGEEDSGVRVWGYGKGAYGDLLKLVTNPQYGDITDTETGVDLDLDYGTPAGAKFPKTAIQAQRLSSKLNDNDEKAADWLGNMPEFNNLFERKTSSDVKVILDEFLSSDQNAEDSSSETTRGGAADGASTASTEATSVDNAFNELLGS